MRNLTTPFPTLTPLDLHHQPLCVESTALTRTYLPLQWNYNWDSRRIIKFTFSYKITRTKAESVPLPKPPPPNCCPPAVPAAVWLRP
ncbi:hypothetical protein DPEC_G00291200 [Dallia pectoralis]|uniref:Uncharacterized protein n=1 Tax=Dallia pectoralis TaxID=75939 RepID=A0ACC2FHK2_DALPE|nr:hypothetical protein DPEC_G00291200 [Dallia pectoralis]